jgi:hypothetical protein
LAILAAGLNLAFSKTMTSDAYHVPPSLQVALPVIISSASSCRNCWQFYQKERS